MRWIFLLPIASIALGGCPYVDKLASFGITQSQVDTLRTGYDGAFLAPAAHYRHLGYCGKVPKQPCADREVVRKLRAADVAVSTALGNLQSQIDANNQTGVLAAFSTLTTAVTAAEALAASLGVK